MSVKIELQTYAIAHIITKVQKNDGKL